jgi:hypothetical protein
MRRTHHCAAFSLIELVVATCVAVMVVAAFTGSVLAAQRLESRGEAVGSRLAAAGNVWERLRSLPFCNPGPSGRGTLTQTLFPHADAAAGSPGGWLCTEPQDGCPAGTFFTTIEGNGLPLRVAATFCVVATGGWTPLPVERLAGYSPLSPPAGRLLIRIRSAGDPTDLVAGVLAGSSEADGAP